MFLPALRLERRDVRRGDPIANRQEDAVPRSRRYQKVAAACGRRHGERSQHDQQTHPHLGTRSVERAFDENEHLAIEMTPVGGGVATTAMSKRRIGGTGRARGGAATLSRLLPHGKLCA
jgi:hypothetical protein